MSNALSVITHRRASLRIRLRAMALRLTTFSGALLALACQGVSAAPSDAQRPAAATPSVAAPSRAEQAAASLPVSRRTAITEAVAKVAPAVVTVQTETVQQVAADPFEMFYGGRSGQRTQAGIGSGFIVKIRWRDRDQRTRRRRRDENERRTARWADVRRQVDRHR